MIEKLNQAAEKMATQLSRRAALGRLGQAALSLAGLVALSSSAAAWTKDNINICFYRCPTQGVMGTGKKGGCPKNDTFNGERCTLLS